MAAQSSQHKNNGSGFQLHYSLDDGTDWQNGVFRGLIAQKPLRRPPKLT